MNYHMCLDVQGFLMNAKKRDYKGMFRHDDGRPMSADEAKAELLKELSKGHIVIPFSPCDNFDYSGGGCQGHHEPEQPVEPTADAQTNERNVRALAQGGGRG